MIDVEIFKLSLNACAVNSKTDFSLKVHILKRPIAIEFKFTENEDWFIGQIKNIDHAEQIAKIVAMQKLQFKKDFQKRMSSYKSVTTFF